MKASEAMRIGIARRPRQIFGHNWDGEDGACAFGAVMDVGVDPEVSKVMLEMKWPTCPACGEWCNSVHPDSVIGGVVQHLNDNVKWTREHIADWLESIGQ